MSEAELNIKINSIFDLLEPALKRKYINGSWKYQTAWGTKTKEGVKECLKTILQDE